MAFDFTKAVQAASVLLEFERGRRMSYMRLLKLLYIADREALAETGRTITGDRAVAMQRGPVLSQVYDLIRGRASKAGDWDRFIHTDGYQVELAAEPGRGQLSRYEVTTLNTVSDRYGELDQEDLSELTHGFEEWKKNFQGGVCRPIPWEDVLTATGRADLIDDVGREERTRQAFDDVFGA